MPRDVAAAIPYRLTPSGEVEVLLVTTRAGAWTVPKGGVKVGATAAETARLEALEEAGVDGTVEAPLGAFSFRKAGRLHRARAFPLRVDRVRERWDEEDVRLRAWVPATEVARFVGRPSIARLALTLRWRLLGTLRAVG